LTLDTLILKCVYVHYSVLQVIFLLTFLRIYEYTASGHIVIFVIISVKVDLSQTYYHSMESIISVFISFGLYGFIRLVISSDETPRFIMYCYP
jgi:hypothetical protein